jgi:hypothetical protein
LKLTTTVVHIRIGTPSERAGRNFAWRAACVAAS